LGILDRQDKDAITLLLAAIPKNQSIVIRLQHSEIRKAAFQASLSFAIGQILLVCKEKRYQKPKKIPALTHEFPVDSKIEQSATPKQDRDKSV
jgi:hypothetical protein